MAERTYASRLIVTRDVETDRYELRRHENDNESELLSFAECSLDVRLLTVSYVETLPQHRNNQFAAMLMVGILDEARVMGWRIRPRCGFAASHIQDHPDMHYLLAS
jgi:predicted GNAT family acetyltransferase